MSIRKRIVIGLCAVAIILIAGVALLGSPPGSRFIVKRGLEAINGRIDGHLSVTGVRGSVFGWLTLDNVILRDRADRVVASAQSIHVEYNLFDILRGRYVVKPVVVNAPSILLVRDQTNTEFTLFDIAPLSSQSEDQGAEAETQNGSFPLFDVEVNVTSGSVVVVLPPRPIPTDATDHVNPRWRMLDTLRLSNVSTSVHVFGPGAEDRSIALTVADLGFGLVEPAFNVHSVNVNAKVLPEVFHIDAISISAENSEVVAEGWFSRDTTTLPGEFSLTVDIPHLASQDVLDFYKPHNHMRMPSDLILAGAVSVQTLANSDEYRAAGNLSLRSVSDSGRIEADGAATFRSLTTFRVERPVSLTAHRFNLAPWMRADSGPVVGPIDGVVRADGTSNSIQAVVDLNVRSATNQVLGDAELEGSVVFSGQYPVVDAAEIERMSVDLGRARQAGLIPTGDGVVEVQGSLDQRDDAFRFDGQFRHYLETRAASVMSGTIEVPRQFSWPLVSAQLTADPLNVQSLSSIVDGLDLQGTAVAQLRIDNEDGSLPFELELRADGDLAIKGRLDFQADTIFVRDGSLVLNGFNADHFYPAVPTELNARVLSESVVIVGQEVQGDLTAHLSPSLVAGVAIDTGGARLGFDRSSLLIDSLRVAGAGFSIAASGNVSNNAARPDTASLHVHIDSVAALTPLLTLGTDTQAPASVQGALQLSMRFDGTLNDGAVTMDVTSPFLAWRESTRLHNMRANGSIRTNGQLDATVFADTARTGGTTLRDLAFRIETAPPVWRWHAAATASTRSSTASGSVLVDSTGILASVDSFELALWEDTWSLDTAMSIDLRDDRQHISSTVFEQHMGDGRVTLSGSVPSADSGAIELNIRALPVQDVVRLVRGEAAALDGILDGTLELRGTASQPELSLSLTTRNGLIDSIPLPDVRLDAQYVDRAARGELEIIQQGRSVARGDLTVPLTLTLPASVRFDSGAVSASLAIDSLPASTFDPAFPAIERVEGSVGGDLTIQGDVRDPEFIGRIGLTNGSLSLPRIGTQYQNVNGTVQFARDSAYVDGVDLTDADGNPVYVTGFVHIPWSSEHALSIDVDATNVLLMNTEEYSAVRGTGQVQVTGSLLAMNVTGEASIGTAIFNVDDLLEKQVIDLEDPLFAEFVDTMVLREQQLANPLVQRIIDSLHVQDLRLVFGDDVWVRSSDLNVQLDGELLVQKVAAEYPTTGSLNTVRGLYEMRFGPGLTREFTLTDGEIRFFGTDSLDAVLDITAQHTVRTVRGEEMTIFANIGGTIGQPSVTLTSDRSPAIPETEIISYLMFGAPSLQVFAGQSGRQQRSVFQRGATQVTQLLAGRLEESLSGVVDYFSITPGNREDGLSEAEIFVGKQVSLLGRTSFVTLSPRLCPAEPLSGFRNVGVSLETWLTSHWLFDVSLDPRKGCRATSTPNATPYQFGADIMWVKR